MLPRKLRKNKADLITGYQSDEIENVLHISMYLDPRFKLLPMLAEEQGDCAKWASDKVKENFETNLKIHCVMQLSLSYEIFRWYPLNIML